MSVFNVYDNLSTKRRIRLDYSAWDCDQSLQMILSTRLKLTKRCLL